MGEVFAGRYELIDPIGRGGVGAVWRAWDHRRRRYVAAKVLQQSDAHTLLRFVREQALRIEHPHVLAPADWAADDDKVLFMELVSDSETGAILYRTTNYFLERMGLRGLDELPELAPFLPEAEAVEPDSLEGVPSFDPDAPDREDDDKTEV
ncbi:hypothetical protein STANM309S_03033 [Streptomyces tanashiensis]